MGLSTGPAVTSSEGGCEAGADDWRQTSFGPWPPHPPPGLPSCLVCRLEAAAGEHGSGDPRIQPGEGTTCQFCEKQFHQVCFVRHLQLEFQDKQWFCRGGIEGGPDFAYGPCLTGVSPGVP